MKFILEPEEIEKKSFEIIGEQINTSEIQPENINVIKRVIHTTADFDYLSNLVFSENAVKIASDILKGGASIVTDTQMAKSGINKKSASYLNCTVDCFIDNETVSSLAKENAVTRASVAVDYAVKNLKEPLIFVVGNAPTALIRIYELVKQAQISPGLIIGAPVGFVNVVESKELIMSLNTPYIVAKGRKGGSNVAAAVMNALLYELARR